MADITMLILADHDWFRERFAELDYLQAQTPVDAAALARVWRPLAEKLDVHAYIEEKIFYPQLLKRAPTIPRAKRLMRSVITTIFATEYATRTRPGSGRRSGGRRSAVPEKPTTTIWLKRNERDCQTSVATLRPAFAKRSDASTASS